MIESATEFGAPSPPGAPAMRAAPRMQRLLRRLRLGMLAVGVALFASLLAEVGLATIAGDLSTIGFGIVAVIVVELMTDWVNAIGWRYTLEPAHRRLPFARLFLVRLAGTAFNQMIPSGTLAGEPVKVLLVQPEVPAPAAWASVITAKFCHSFAQALFVSFALISNLERLHFPPLVWRGLLLAVTVVFVGVAAFFWVQHQGLFATIAAGAHRMRVPERWIRVVHRWMEHVDEPIRAFYSSRRRDFAAALFWHFSSFFFSVIGIYFLLTWLGLPAAWLSAIAVEGFLQVIALATFLVPAGLGVREGGMMLVFTGLGLPAAAGLSIALATRIVQLGEILLGLVGFGLLHWRHGRARFTG